MDSEREMFEKLIKENRYDGEIRRVYADWLEENGLDDEALEQRRCAALEWQEADKWMHDFASKLGMTCTEGYGTGHWNSETQEIEGAEEEKWEEITYDDAIQAGHNVIADKWDYFTQLGSEEARDLMCQGNNREQFWKNWEIITGIKVSEEDQECTVFSCSC